MNVGAADGFCLHTADMWQFIGLIIMIFKILIPIMLICVAMITLGKIIISDDDKEIKKGIFSLIKKFLICAVVFFIPTLITVMFGIVHGFEELEEDFSVCEKCVVDPTGDFCKSIVGSSAKE